MKANKKQEGPVEMQPGDYYMNDKGLMVFTAQYHLRRGYCCSNGCRHCPYKKERDIKQ